MPWYRLAVVVGKTNIERTVECAGDQEAEAALGDLMSSYEGATGGWVACPEPIISVSLFMAQQCYGGPEEGGWWYTEYTPVPLDQACQICSDFPDTPQRWQPMFFKESNRRYANQICEFRNKWVNNSLNLGRPSLTSSLSIGRYIFKIQDGYPHLEPTSRPRYE